MLEERYLSHCVVCAPSEQLYVSYPRVLLGEETSQSEIVSSIHHLFPDLLEDRGLPMRYFANTKESAFRALSAAFTQNSGEAAALRKLFSELPEFAGRTEALRRAADLSDEQIRDRSLLERYRGKELYLSPTKIETFYSCHFRYFCQYMLGARERRAAEVDAMQYGSMMHRLFERMFAPLSPPVETLTDEALSGILEREIGDYISQNMGGMEALSGRDRYRMQRMTTSATLLVRHVSEELSQSRFQPEQLEMRLGYGGDFPPLRIRSPQGNIVTVGGTVDRVDIYENERGTFVRVVDYKTGSKSFQLADVLYGLNLQMLIYLAALVESGEVLPAGVLYTPIASPTATVDGSMSEAEVAKAAEKSLRMNGLILSEAEIVTAMEDAAEGRFIPVKLKKDGSVAASTSAVQAEQLQAVLQHSKRLIATMADALMQGHVEAKPMMKNINSCGLCPYGSVCGREYSEKDVEKVKIDREELLSLMGRSD